MSLIFLFLAYFPHGRSAIGQTEEKHHRKSTLQNPAYCLIFNESQGKICGHHLNLWPSVVKKSAK